MSQTRDEHLKELEKEYEKRMSPYARLNTLSVAASKFDTKNQAQEEERDLLLEKLDKDSWIIVLDETGRLFNSEYFAKEIMTVRDHGKGSIQFVIGGSHGLHKDILKRADLILSFSKMTFTHEMIRVFLKEQIYRAFTILVGKKYHK